MNKKIEGLFLCILLFATTISVAMSENTISSTTNSISSIITDITPPVTTCTLDGEMYSGNFFGIVTMTLSATDDESGVRETWMCIHLGDGGACVWRNIQCQTLWRNR